MTIPLNVWAGTFVYTRVSDVIISCLASLDNDSLCVGRDLSECVSLGSCRTITQNEKHIICLSAYLNVAWLAGCCCSEGKRMFCFRMGWTTINVFV